MGLILDTSYFSQSGKRIAENKDLSRVFGKFFGYDLRCSEKKSVVTEGSIVKNIRCLA